MPGAPISRPVKVVELSSQGFWIDVGDERLYVGFADFPWFAGARAEQIGEVCRPGADHLYWPQLDVDLSLAALRDPAAFPLVAAVRR